MRQLADSSLLCTETNQPTNQPTNESPKEGDNECNIFVQTSPFCLLMKWSKAFGSVWFLFSGTVLCSWKQKTCLGKGLCFVFFVFFVFSKTSFLRTIKRCFHCFFNVQCIDCFSCFLFLLCVFSYLLFMFLQR